MSDDFERYNGASTVSLVQRYERMLKKGITYFFDIDEIEDIYNYYVNKLNYSKAENIIKYGLKLFPASTSLLNNKAQLFIIQQKYSKALDILNITEYIEPDNFEIFLAKGYIFSELKQHDKAIDEYRKALALVDQDSIAEIYVKLAHEFQILGYFEQSLEYFLKANDAEPYDEEILFDISYCYELSGNTETSIKFLNKIIDINPYSADAWFYLGINFHTLTLYEKAIDAFDFVIAIDFSYTAAYINKASSLYNLNKFKEAIEITKESFIYEEPASNSYYFLGQCYEKLYDSNLALENYIKAINLDNSYSDAYFNAGIIYDSLDQNDKSLNFINKAIEIEPTNVVFLTSLAEILIKYENFDDAYKTLEKISILELTPEIILDISNLCYQTEQYKKAIEILNNGINQFPDKVELIYRMVAYQLAAGKKKAALNTLIKAVSIDKDKAGYLVDYAPHIIDIPDFINVLLPYNPNK